MWFGGPTTPFASFSSRNPSSQKPKPQRVPREELQPPLRGGEHQREKSSPRNPGNSLREGEIDAIVTVIELDIIAITIIIISTIITAVSTAGHLNSSSKLLVNTFCSSLGSTFLLIEDTTIHPLYLWVINPCYNPRSPNIVCFFPFQGEEYSFSCNSSFRKPDLRVVISSLESFASQYASLEVDKAQLQKEVESSSSKLEGTIKIAPEARTEIDTLKEELEELKRRLKDEEAARLTAEARAMEKDDLLRQSSLALLSNPLFVPFLIIAFANIDSFVNVFLHASFFSGAADIPVEALDEVPNNSPSNTLSMTLASHQLLQELLQKGKGAMARIHLMIFPKISQDKTLGQLIDAFAVNTKEVIEQAGEIDNLTVSLGQSTLVVLCRFHVGAGIPGVAPHYIPPPSTFDVLLDSYWFDKPFSY
ncbi:hypothetical protein QYE76_035452 [Lolium multiflorum]|uniref:Uncharacterized protein n=1 Tax=Lolium multiflorum TaxID=4521 RepID=A0AAD8VM81_LOLMU|nr:hypothetical protein QYE76_035452 [Lolium multiflorum]